MDPSSKRPTYVKVIVWAIVVIAVLVITAWIYQFYKQNIVGNRSNPTISPSPSAIGPLNITKSPSPNQTSNTSGNWTLSMSNTTVSTSPETRLDGTASGQVSFEMPSGGQTVTAAGDWSGNSSGTSGPSTVEGTSNGKMTITGEIKNGKLHFTVSYAYDHCSTTIVSPVMTVTNEDCPTTPSESYSIDIDTSDGATASHNITSAAVNGTENWTLKKK